MKSKVKKSAAKPSPITPAELKKWGCEKVAKIGYQKEEGWLAYIAPTETVGTYSLQAAKMDFKSDTPQKKEIKRFQADLKNLNFVYYVDSDGDVSRCSKKNVTAVKKSGWPGGL